MAVIPSVRGIRRSISTTSGAWASTAAGTSPPSAASPTTSIPCAPSSIIVSPARTRASSSTRSTRIRRGRGGRLGGRSCGPGWAGWLVGSAGFVGSAGVTRVPGGRGALGGRPGQARAEPELSVRADPVVDFAAGQPHPLGQADQAGAGPLPLSDGSAALRSVRAGWRGRPGWSARPAGGRRGGRRAAAGPAGRARACGRWSAPPAPPGRRSGRGRRGSSSGRDIRSVSSTGGARVAGLLDQPVEVGQTRLRARRRRAGRRRAAR